MYFVLFPGVNQRPLGGIATAEEEAKGVDNCFCVRECVCVCDGVVFRRT